MPLKSNPPPKYSPPKEAIITWDTWRKGLNLRFRENEIDGAEMTLSTNLLLTGSGIPTKRWGSQDYFLSGPTGNVRFLLPIKDSSDNMQVLALTDWGFLSKKDNASYTMLLGASWPSGYNIEGTQLGGNIYLFSEAREMVKYDFTSLTPYHTLSAPTAVNASNISGATGTSSYQWSVTTVGGSGGETIGSNAVLLNNLPGDLSLTAVRISWTAPSAASGAIIGYNVYRQSQNEFIWQGGTDSTTTEFTDIGTFSIDTTKLLPETNTTAGLMGKYVIRFQDRLVVAGIPGHPTQVWISGRWPYNERFDSLVAGGSVEIEPDSGQDITGLGIYQEKLVVFKENSVWQISLAEVQYGIYVSLDPQYKLLTASQGCSSHRSIIPVENDLMFSNRKGIYILRYEPQLINILNANEISAKIKPFFEGLSDADLTSAVGAYIDKKYILSFPFSKQTIVFDRERLSFVGPWTTPFGISAWARYVDSTGTEKWIAGDSDDAFVSEFSKGYLADKNTTITTIFKSRKEDFKDWTIFKTLNEVYMNFRNIFGSISVNIYIEERSGRTITAKSFTIVGEQALGVSGIGTDPMGLFGMGITLNTPTVSSGETPKKSFIYKTTRTMQIEIRTTGYTDSYELLGIKAVATPQARGGSPASWTI